MWDEDLIDQYQEEIDQWEEEEKARREAYESEGGPIQKPLLPKPIPPDDDNIPF